MKAAAQSPLRRPEPTFAELFTPKLVTVLRDGYSASDFRADAIAGLTVAIVALPLSMAIAIGSGLSPDKGLFTAVVGGFLISALGGSRFQIGGPAGAFIVLIASIVERRGYDGLVLATLTAGLMMMAAGFLRLGTYIKYIPFPVTVGFTAGIAVIILASQLKDLLGLDITREPDGAAAQAAGHLGEPRHRQTGNRRFVSSRDRDHRRRPPPTPQVARFASRRRGNGGACMDFSTRRHDHRIEVR